MIVGNKNSVNEKLVEKISIVFPVELIEYNAMLNGVQPSYEPKIILVNLMDVGANESEVLSYLKTNYPQSKLIAIHCFQLEAMIQSTLAKGYDEYVSIFDISENIVPAIEKLSA